MTEVPDPRRLEELLLGGELRYTSLDAIRTAGVSEEFARRLWRALGFPHVPDDMIAFTEGDVTALAKVAGLRPAGLVDEEIVLRMVRAVGQTMARLATWQIDILVETLADPLEPPDPETLRAITENAETHIAELEPLIVHAWRRQLAAAGARLFSAQGSEHLATRAAIGFADLVAFTRTSRDLDEHGLARLVERFEETASDVVAEHGGRLVKTLGDEVLFVADDAKAGAEIGLRIAERVDADPEFPRVRVGLAHGEIVQRLGDVFGTPVNLAARLTSTAHPATVLADGGLIHLLGETGAYDAVPLRARPLQGLGRVRPWVLRRRTD